MKRTAVWIELMKRSMIIFRMAQGQLVQQLGYAKEYLLLKYDQALYRGSMLQKPATLLSLSKHYHIIFIIMTTVFLSFTQVAVPQSIIAKENYFELLPIFKLNPQPTFNNNLPLSPTPSHAALRLPFEIKLQRHMKEEHRPKFTKIIDSSNRSLPVSEVSSPLLLRSNLRKLSLFDSNPEIQSIVLISEPGEPSKQLQPSNPQRDSYEDGFYKQDGHTARALQSLTKRYFSEQAKKQEQKDARQPPKIKLKFNRDERIVFALDASLQKFKVEHNLSMNRPQIKYVNTLKKMKSAGERLGCSVEAKSSGIELQMQTLRERTCNDIAEFNQSKEFDRYFRKKLVKRIKTCKEERIGLQSTAQKSELKVRDTIKINKMNDKYTQFTARRMETSLRSKATHNPKLPFSVKKQLDEKFQEIRKEEEAAKLKEKDEMSDGSESDLHQSPVSRKTINPDEKGSKNTTSSKWTSLFNDYQQDIIQFLQICEFLKKIQHELLRYQPNNHLSNKINNILDQVERGEAIRKIYDKCNVDFEYLTPRRIVGFLKREEGILSSMNYLVNVIKLNISAERRKRFKDTEKTIERFQHLIKGSAGRICDRLKEMQSSKIKSNVITSLKGTDISCSGLNPVYLQFVKQAQHQQFSQLGTTKNRRVICQILKFQALMK